MKPMNLGYLRLFNVLASELSFSKAACILYISQPALSMQIKKLEEELGFKLIDRSGRQLTLTENGKILYQYTKEIFRLVDEAESVLSNRNDNIKGIVEIGASNAPGTYILPAILGEYRQLYPDVITYLHISTTHDIEKMVLEGKIDFAVIGGTELENNKLNFKRLCEDELIFIASPINPLTNKEYVDYYDLIDSKFIMHEKSSKLCNLIEAVLHELNLPENTAMTLGHIDAIKQAVELNLGISAAPASAVKVELKHNLLKPLKFKDKSWFYPYNLVYLKERNRSNAVVKLMELIKERMKQLK